jgi:eukaryotic-like serine/threonine-protein kinase
MNPTPDDSSEIEPPMTRALFATDLDKDLAELAADPDGTVEVDTHRHQPMTDSVLSRVARSEPVLGSVSAWSGPGAGTGSDPGSVGRRGIFGKIEPEQTLYSKYRVLKKLGGGAMGDVWLVRHVTLKSEHALKVIVPNFAKNAVALMRFQREFEVMATLRHEHAVTIYDACIDEDGGYIDMEYVDGKTLHDVLTAARSRPDHDPAEPLMPLDWIVRLLDQLCDVLQIAHEKGIVHRDLKPSNMMLLSGRKPGKEYLKVLDFGIAKIRDDPDGAAGRDQEEHANRTEGFIGTPSYGSPEQAMAREDVDGRADLYSVGIMLYEFITGRLPFRGSPLQVMSQNASAPPPPFHEVNPKLKPIPEVEHAVFRVLSKDRDQRPQTARQLFDEFRDAVEAVLPPGSPGLTPPTWDAVPFYSPPSSLSATIMPTEHEGQLSGAMISTLQQTLLSEPSHPELRKSARESPSDLGPVYPDRPGRPWFKISVIAGPILLTFLTVGVVVLARRPVAPPPGPSPREAEESSVLNSKVLKETSSFESHWPENYLPVEGFGQGKLFPDKVRRTPEDLYFYKFADGIYLPEGYTAENPKDLEDGWPRVIVRDKIRFLRIKGGQEWKMGAWDAGVETGRPDVPAHAVKLSGYYIQETEVTNGQFEDYLQKRESVRPKEWERIFLQLKRKLDTEVARQHPAVNLSRKQAMQFAKSIDAQLPTEAQWEYAARSRGEKRRYVWGDTPPPTHDKANIETWVAMKTAPVGSYPDDKTVQGAVDMLGNVQEICRDSWEPYAKNVIAVDDPCPEPSDPAKAEFAIRGAYFNSIPDDCALTNRAEHVSDNDVSEKLGFRLVVECPDTRKPR